MGSPSSLLYEDIPRVDMWLKLLLGGIPAVFFVLGIVLLFENKNIGDVLVAFGVAIFYVLLFTAIIPRRYQVYSDRLRIVLGGPFVWNIHFSTIKEARSASGAKAFAYWGVRLATSSKGVVEIVRSRGCSVVISPSNSGLFLEQLNGALESVARR